MSKLRWIENVDDDVVQGYNLADLSIDECYIKLVNHNTFPVYLYNRLKECYKCPFTQLLQVHKLKTKYDQEFRILTKPHDMSPISSNDSVLCELDPGFNEFGIYHIHVNNTSCSVNVLHDSVNIYFPMLTVFLIYTLLFILVFLLIIIVKRLHASAKGTEADPITKVKKNRVKSLDTFRGFSIIFMIFVNYGAGGYEVLEHATWNGLHFADLVFPWFLWIMGVCIPMSILSSLRRGISKKSAILNVIRRSCILFGLGIFLGSGQYLDRLRIFGVLQRFGICYFVVGTMFIMFAKIEQEGNNSKNTLSCICDDILKLKYQWLIIITILIVHCLITFLLPIPGCPMGYLGPGGLHLDGKYNECTGGAAGYIDKLILGIHIYQFPTISEVYKSGAFDPEGILGCLTSVIQVFLGVQAGMTLVTYKEHLRRISRWVLWGLATGLIGAILCGFSKEEGVIPVNKNLWSISFVLVTSSMAFLFLSVCYYVIDVRKVWTGKPILFAGMNSTIMYVGHSLVWANFPIQWYTSMDAAEATHFIELIKDVWSTTMWLLVAVYLYKIKFFLSI